MGGNNIRQKKSSSFMSVFNIFKASNSRHRGGHQNHDAYEDRGRKVWPSDEDRGRWGVAEPGIDMRAAAFIAAQYQKRVSESEIHCQAQPQ